MSNEALDKILAANEAAKGRIVKLTLFGVNIEVRQPNIQEYRSASMSNAAIIDETNPDQVEGAAAKDARPDENMYRMVMLTTFASGTDTPLFTSTDQIRELVVTDEVMALLTAVSELVSVEKQAENAAKNSEETSSAT